VGEFSAAASNLTESTTWLHRGVPYFLRAGNQSRAFRFEPDVDSEGGHHPQVPDGHPTNEHLRIGFTVNSGVTPRLLVEGTADQKVTFEALSGTAPAWSGMSIFPAAQQSRINHAVIRHTGLESRSMVQDCTGIRTSVTFALAINFASLPGLQPSADLVRNTIIRDAAIGSVGFQRSWIVEGAGSSSINLLYAASGNSVVGLQCRQSGYSLSQMNMPIMCFAGCE